MSEDKNDRKRKFRKQFYGKKKKGKFDMLQPGDKGFLITCMNGNENKAIREAYDLLTEYADTIYGVDKANVEDKVNTATDSSDDEEEDIELALKAECCQIKENQGAQGATSAKGETQQPHSRFSRFKAVDCKVKNCCFIKWNMDNVKPSHLAFAIMSDFLKTKKLKCRFIQRLLPIDVTCKTFDKDFFENSKILLENEFTVKSPDDAGQRLTYDVQFKSRHSDVISRDAAIRIIGELISTINPTVKVDLTRPDKTVLIEILGKMCCLSIVRDYHQLHRYNVHQIVKDTVCE